MKLQKLLFLLVSVSLLAAGCSKAKTETSKPVQTEQSAVVSTPAVSEFDPTQDWIRFYPSEGIKFNLAFSKKWFGDENPTDTHFVIRSRKDADGTKPSDVTMDFTIKQLTAAGLSAQVMDDSKGAKDSSPVIIDKTDSGIPYAFVSYVDSAGKPVSAFALQYEENKYVAVKVTGNIVHPYIGRIIQSITAFR